MKVLFVNPSQPRCGVHQYGLRFFSLLQMCPSIQAEYIEPGVDGWYLNPDWDKHDVVIYNTHPGIPGFPTHPSPSVKAKQVAIFHEGSMEARFDAWLVSDPGLSSQSNIYSIGRPLPDLRPMNQVHCINENITIGVSGFLGAWAPDMVRAVLEQVPEAVIRLHLPHSDHMDRNGDMARSAVEACRQISTTTTFHVYNDFMDEFNLLNWLGQNDLNCYIRPHTGSLGISSALDFALACHRPIAINKNPMFRYLHGCSPSICIEDTPIRDIIKNGINPLEPHYQRNDRAKVAAEIRDILMRVVA